jgi:hypothetical protein
MAVLDCGQAPLIFCSHCDATADRLDPPGWVVANPVMDLGLPHEHGVCPACLTDVYEFPDG